MIALGLSGCMLILHLWVYLQWNYPATLSSVPKPYRVGAIAFGLFLILQLSFMCAAGIAILQNFHRMAAVPPLPKTGHWHLLRIGLLLFALLIVACKLLAEYAGHLA